MTLQNLMNPAFFSANEHKVICLDEIQRFPELFSTLRSEIDRNRTNGRFILLGSASRELIQKSAESLAGRIGIIKLTPFLVSELIIENKFNLNKYWLRGAYPDSYLATTDSASVLWRENFISTYVERDIPQLGFQIPAQHLKRMLIMSAHSHAQLFNASKLGESLGLTHPTIKRYLDLLEQTFILRSLQPYELNIKKRLIKSPKLYFYDIGLACSLLKIQNPEMIKTHYLYGALYENLIISEIIKQQHHSGKIPAVYYWRESNGTEIDCIIESGAQKIIALEIKAGETFNKDYLKNFKNLPSGDDAIEKTLIYTGENSTSIQDVKLLAHNKLNLFLTEIIG